MDDLYVKARNLGEHYEWIGEVLQSLDQIMYDELKPWREQGAKHGYIDYNFLDLLSDISVLLDRCVAYRREYLDLQSAAVRQVMDYELFRNQYDTLLSLDRALWQQELRETESKFQKQAADKFDESPGLGSGFAELARGGDTLNQETLLAEQERDELVKKRWKSLKDHQDLLKARHTQEGHPLNFIDRATRVKNLLLEDLKEAADKAMYVRRSLKNYLSLEEGDELYSRYLYLNSNKPLDDFLKWTRDTIRVVERTLQWDCDYSRGHLSVSQNFPLKGSIKIDPPDGILAPRLRSIGLSIILKKDEKLQDLHNLTTAFKITLAGRPPFLLTGCGPSQSNTPVRFFDGRQVFNWKGGAELEYQGGFYLEHSTQPGSVSALHLLGIHIHTNWVCRPTKMDVDLK